MLRIQNKDGSVSSFEVRQFEYTGALSQPYVLVLEVLDVSNSLAELKPLLCPATLEYVDSADETAYLSGVVTGLVKRTDPVKQKTFYQIKIEPYLALLSLERQFRVHNQQSFLEIAQELVQDLTHAYGLAGYADYQVTEPWLVTPIRSHDVQCEDHHLDYFNKLLSFARYYFTQTESGETLQVIDGPILLPTRKQNILLDYSRKEDVQDGTPCFYVLNRSIEAQNLEAVPFYFDPFYPKASLSAIKTGNPLVFETSVFAPVEWQDFVKAKLTEQLSHHKETFAFKTYYSHLNVGEQIKVTSLSGKSIELFIESLSITGHYQDEAWRFDVSGIARPYDPSGLWLGEYQARRRLPATIKGAILQDSGQVDDDGLYQVKFPVGFDVGREAPTISVREIQETVTRDGGASHSVSGTANAVLVTQDGLPADLLLMGSLIDNKRASHIGLDNYREAGVQMKGGLKIHMRRQDANNPHGELGVQLKDSQGNPAHMTLGANPQTLSEEGDTSHGIKIGSTGQASTLTSGNSYTNTGDVNYPVHQTSLVRTDDEEETIQPATETNNDYDIFVATVYGEASGQSQNAWKAVGSVIVNRIGKGYWKSCKTPGEVAAQPGQFDAYDKAPYNEALQAIQNNEMDTQPKLAEMYSALKPIYAGDVITNANFYYSPKTQAQFHNKFPQLYPATPKFLKPWVKPVSIPALASSDDFKFYYDPNNGDAPSK